MTDWNVSTTLLAFGRQSLAGLRTLLLLTLVCGVAYPLLVWGIGQAAVGWRADGSLVTSTGAHTRHASDAVGSALVGQQFSGAKWFLPRASNAGDGYDPLATAASNLGPNDPALVKLVRSRQAEVARREGVSPSQVPPDAVTSSGSGLDPDVSPAYAALQVPRVAKARGLSVAAVQQVVSDATHGRVLGFLGDAHVDVLAANLALQRLARGAGPS